MGTWLPETCWATCKREIKDSTEVTSSCFLSTLISKNITSQNHHQWRSPFFVKHEAMSLGKWFPKFRLDILVYFQMSNIQSIKTPEDESTMLLRKVGHHSPSNVTPDDMRYQRQRSNCPSADLVRGLGMPVLFLVHWWSSTILSCSCRLSEQCHLQTEGRDTDFGLVSELKIGLT